MVWFDTLYLAMNFRTSSGLSRLQFLAKNVSVFCTPFWVLLAFPFVSSFTRTFIIFSVFSVVGWTGLGLNKSVGVFAFSVVL